jgi:uncharacterized protein (TIGR00251 family)
MKYDNALRSDGVNTLIKVHAITGASKTIFPAGYDDWRGCIIIKVKSQPRGNRANKEIIDAVSGFFGLNSRDVSIINGARNNDKTLLLANTPYYHVYDMLKEAL